MVRAGECSETHRRVVLFIIVVVLLTATLFIRLYDIEADPPSDFSASGGYWADEGFWTHSARNRVLFGTWVMDGWNNMYVSPLLHWFTYGVFRQCGVSLMSARLVPIVLSLLGILVLVLTLARSHGPRVSLLVLLFLGCQYPYCIYNRIAIVETPATFFVIAGFCCLCFNRPLVLSGGGALLAAAVITKSTLSFLFPAAVCSILIAEWLSPSSARGYWRRSFMKLFFLCAGAAGPLLAWWFFIVSPHREMLSGYNHYYRGMLLPSTIGEAIRNMVTQPFHIFFNRLPILMVLAHCALGMFIIGMRDRRYRPSHLEVHSMIFWVSGVVFLSFFSYRPFRYYVPLIPFMTISAALLIERLFTSGLTDLRNLVSDWPRKVLLASFIGFPLVINGFFLVDRVLLEDAILGRLMKVWPVVGIWYPGMVIVLVTGFLLLLLLFVLPRVVDDQHVFFLRMTAVIFIVGFMLVQGAGLIGWLGSPTHTVRDINRYLDRFPEEGAFTGQWAGALCLATSHRVIPVFTGFVNDDRPFERFCIRYALLWQEYGHTDMFFREYPEVSHDATHLEDFRVKNTVVHFFALPPCSSYENE